MSKINELIKEKCSNGVIYKTLDKLVSISTGKLNANAMVDDGEYAFFTCDANPFRIDTYAFDGEAILISGNGSQVGHLNYYVGKFNAYQRTYVLMNFSDELTAKYLYHYLSTYLKGYINENSKKGSVPYITLPILTTFKVALPPIEIQKEIVQILDKFGELEGELEAELEARKSQYKFWRGQMFNHKGNTKISDIFTRVKGTSITAGKMKEIENPGGKIRIFAGGQTAVNANLEDIPKANIIDYPCVIVQSRGLIDFVYYDKPFTFKNEMWAYTCDNQVTVQYLYYYLKNNVNYFREIGTQMGSMPQISLPVTEKFEIYLPALEEQKKIVNILDKFEKLISDISIGLPAEIELRRQQYEYYRNKLLSFEEVNVSE